jgi:hypothetical protein
MADMYFGGVQLPLYSEVEDAYNLEFRTLKDKKYLRLLRDYYIHRRRELSKIFRNFNNIIKKSIIDMYIIVPNIPN